MNIFKKIYSYFWSSNENATDYMSIYPPYSLLTESSLTIKQVQQIQDIIEQYGNKFNQEKTNKEYIQNAYNDLISISSQDENLRLFLHELMFFTSIRMNQSDFYVDLSKLIITNHPNLQNFIKSQIFWCFDNFSDLYVYKSIEKNLISEGDLQPFENSLKFDINFYYVSESNYNPHFKYLRFSYLYENVFNEYKNNITDFTFKKIYEENVEILKDLNYKQNMRKCMRMNPMLVGIRNDNSNSIGTENLKIISNIIERNEYLIIGCDLLSYSAFYGSKNCFNKLIGNQINIQSKLNEKNEYSSINKISYFDCNQLSLSDFASCGGDMEICTKLHNLGFKFTSISLRFAIRYHRKKVFEWLINELGIEMDEDCYKSAVQYEFIPAIEVFQYKFNKIDLSLELSKSGNYVLFIELFDLNKVGKHKNGESFYTFKYAPIMPIFLYNSIDCYRFLLSISKKIDLNFCCLFDYIHYYSSVFNYKSLENPFHIAIKRQFVDLMKMILAYGMIDVNKIRKLVSDGGFNGMAFSKIWKSPPLEIAILTDNIDIVKIIIQIKEIDVNQISILPGEKNSIIRIATVRGNLDIIETLLKSPRIDKNTKSFRYDCSKEMNILVKNSDNIDDEGVINLLSKYSVK